MAKGYTIADKKLNKGTLESYYTAAKKTIKADKPEFDFTDLDSIFKIGADKMDRFPNFYKSAVSDPKSYMDRWVKDYVNAMENLPSEIKVKPKASCNDPAVKLLVKTTQHIDDKSATNKETAHCLFMSAENTQGKLLEEYIYIKTHPYGFLWCAGKVLKSVDFCNADGTYLLQIKNKNNSENSSSMTVREGTNIDLWYRLKTSTQKGVNYPAFRWSDLNDKINKWKTSGVDLPPCDMSEDDYNNFLKNVATKNPEIITDK